jgi:hypothetical protein
LTIVAQQPATAKIKEELVYENIKIFKFSTNILYSVEAKQENVRVPNMSVGGLQG